MKFKYWIITSTDDKLIVKGSANNRSLVVVSDLKDKKHLRLYSSEKCANTAITKSYISDLDNLLVNVCGFPTGLTRGDHNLTMLKAVPVEIKTV